jgi:hypothetical protein
MHLYVKNCAQLRISLLLCERKFFSSPILRSASDERFPGSCSLHRQQIWLLIFIRSNKFSYPRCVATCPCFLWSSAVLLNFNKGSAFRKHIEPAKGLCSWHCIVSKGLLKYSMCCGGTVTELNTKKYHTAARCSVLTFSWRDSQTRPDMSCTYSTLRHCTAMPLQLGMEEGPTSKSVRVSGLHYCL